MFQEQVSEDEFKAFIVYVQELENENLVLKSRLEASEREVTAALTALNETREIVLILETLNDKKDNEIKICIDENTLLRQQVTEYKFLYEHTKPSAFDKTTSTIGIGTGVAAFIYFIVQMMN